MTYNIQGHAASRRPAHIAGIAEVIMAVSPDVVGLQEVHCRTRASTTDQAEELSRLTGLNLSFGRSCAIDGGDYGNAVLTRGTIHRSEVHALPGAGEARSMLETDIDLAGETMTFFVTHLAAWGRLLRTARMAQITQLAEITARPSRPQVLVGDFNVPPKAEEIQVLESRGHLHRCGQHAEVTYPLTRQRLDFVFCGPQWDFVSSEVLSRGPSDHRPVVVELRLKAA